MSPENQRRTLLDLLTQSLKKRREAMSQYGVDSQGARCRAILEAGAAIGLVTPEEFNRLSWLASNAMEYRGKELANRLPPYGNWGRQNVGVAA